MLSFIEILQGENDSIDKLLSDLIPLEQSGSLRIHEEAFTEA